MALTGFELGVGLASMRWQESTIITEVKVKALAPPLRRWK
jgi:hypothetical protein